MRMRRLGLEDMETSRQHQNQWGQVNVDNYLPPNKQEREVDGGRLLSDLGMGYMIQEWPGSTEKMAQRATHGQGLNSVRQGISAISADSALRGSVSCLVGSMDVVPHAERAPVLRHHHVAVRHPLDVRAVAQEGPSRLRSDVVPVFRAIVEVDYVCGWCLSLLVKLKRRHILREATPPTITPPATVPPATTKTNESTRQIRSGDKTNAGSFLEPSTTSRNSQIHYCISHR